MLTKIDILIKSGNIDDARRLQLEFLKSGYGRHEIVIIARNLRRLGLMMKALKILFPFVYPQFSHDENINPEEIIEYAINLSRLGGSNEALRLLSKVTSARHPEALFASGFAMICDWRYDEAVPYFKRYIEVADVEPYRRRIGAINLIAAFVFLERFSEAKKEIEALRAACLQHHENLLLANTSELEAQIEFQEGRLSQAKKLLDKAGQLLGAATFSDSLRIQKWQVLVDLKMDLKKKGSKSETLEGIKKTRQLAMSINHWETLRELDFRVGEILADEALLSKVYFGSPYLPLKNKIENAANRIGLTLPEYYLYIPYIPSKKRRLVEDELKPKKYFDMETISSLKTGQLPHRLLSILASDFYRPMPIIALHNKVFPDASYHVNSSPNVMSVAVHRLNKLLEEKETCMSVKACDQAYQLNVGKRPLLIKRKFISSSLEKYETLLRNAIGNNAFKRKDAARIFDMPMRSTSRTLSELVEKGLLKKMGSANRTTYYVVKTGRGHD